MRSEIHLDSLNQRMDELKTIFSDHPSSSRIKGDTTVGIRIELAKFEERLKKQEWKKARKSAREIIRISRKMDELCQSQEGNEKIEEEIRGILDTCFPAIRRGGL